MKLYLKKIWPYLLILIINFYCLPLLINNTGLAMVILLAAVPMICLACALVYGIKHSFSLLYCIISIVMFVPSIFIYYNSSAWVYIVAYGILAIMGNLMGMVIHKNRK